MAGRRFDIGAPYGLLFAQLALSLAGRDRDRVSKIVDESLKGADDGELYLEYSQSESLVYDDGRLKNASFDTSQGFGLRAVAGETAGFSHASELSEAAIKRAAISSSASSQDTGWNWPLPLGPTRRSGVSTRSGWSVRSA